MTEGELNEKRTWYNFDVWRLRPEASKKLEELKDDIKKELENTPDEKELARVIYPEEPLDSGENLWEAKLSASNGVLKIEKKPFGDDVFSELTLIPPGRLNYLIGDLHPQVIIDLAKQLEEK